MSRVVGGAVAAPPLSQTVTWVQPPGGVTLASLAGRPVVLHFWSSCCVACEHLSDDLSALERARPDGFVIIGVHVPKFAHERDGSGLAQTVARLGVSHPVLHDGAQRVCAAYAVTTWPTLVALDHHGSVRAKLEGADAVPRLEALLDRFDRERVGSLPLASRFSAPLEAGPEAFDRPRPGPAPTPTPTPRQRERERGGGAGQPLTVQAAGGLVALASGGFVVSDVVGHRLVVLDRALGPVAAIGSGVAGLADGGADDARFDRPRGMAQLPSGQVIVADSGNHCLRLVDVDRRTVRTVAGTGRRLARRVSGGDARTTAMASPWDVAWSAHVGGVVVAMAGLHQLWWYDPVEEAVAVLAGTSVEGHKDGAARRARLAQPSGVATDARDGTIWFTDADTSALRWLRDGEVGTAVGGDACAWGHRDGAAGRARLQHPQGLFVDDDGSVLIADCFNGAIRRFDPGPAMMGTLASGLFEPSGVVAGGFGERGLLAVAGADGVVLRAAAVDIVDGLVSQDWRPTPISLRPGRLVVDVAVEPAFGYALDPSMERPLAVSVAAEPASLLGQAAGPLVLDGARGGLVVGEGHGMLKVVIEAATCDATSCRRLSTELTYEVTVSPDGADRLIVSVMDEPALEPDMTGAQRRG